MTRRLTRTLPIAMLTVAGLTLAACSGGDTDVSATGADDTAAETSEEMTSDDMTSDDMTSEETSDAMGGGDIAAAPVGPQCAAVAEQISGAGEGSIEGMTDDPVATAASNNPLLTQLTAALSGQLNPGVNLVDTLNSAEALTVLAPTDDAFAQLDQATLDTLTTDAAQLESILTYHVIPEQYAPETLPDMSLETLQGGEVTFGGTAEELTVNDSTAVLCGGVNTGNAQVYLIDTVLTPPAG